MGFQKKTLFLVVAAVVFGHSNAKLVEQWRWKSRRLPNLNVCGRGKVIDEPRIIGGSPAELGEFPWMAAIGYGYNEGDVPKWLCGGSLITDQYVITAAHCVHPEMLWPRKVITVRLGELNLDPNVNDGALHKDVNFEKIIYHEQFDNTKIINDVGLIKLKEKITFSDKISPICLSHPDFQGESFEGFTPVVAGWGRTIANLKAFDTRLMKVEVEIRNTAECRINNTSTLRPVVIDDRVICAASPGKDSCRGDSGGPMMFYKDGNTYLMGLVSYGYGCAREYYPAVYVRVTEYIRWIVDNLDI